VRRDCELHRGRLLGVLGGVSLVCGFLAPILAVSGLIGLPLAVAVLMLASRDLARVRRGRLDAVDQVRGETEALVLADWLDENGEPGLALRVRKRVRTVRATRKAMVRRNAPARRCWLALLRFEKDVADLFPDWVWYSMERHQRENPPDFSGLGFGEGESLPQAGRRGGRRRGG
jgi:hypothetical protein